MTSDGAAGTRPRGSDELALIIGVGVAGAADGDGTMAGGLRGGNDAAGSVSGLQQ